MSRMSKQYQSGSHDTPVTLYHTYLPNRSTQAYHVEDKGGGGVDLRGRHNAIELLCNDILLLSLLVHF